MKIVVDTSERYNITLRIPTRLLCSRLCLRLLANKTSDCKKSRHIPSRKQLRELRSIIRSIKKQNKEWELVDVCSSEGERVRITL